MCVPRSFERAGRRRTLTEVVIAGACRTPIGKYGRAYRNVEAVKLGSVVVAEAVKRAGLISADIEEVILGNVIQAGLGQNPARQAALLGGLPDRVAAVTVNKVCASGMKSVSIASDAIRSGSSEIILAGGMESMSRAPYLVKEARWGTGYNHVPFLDAMVHDGLWDAFNQFHMGMTGEIVSGRYKVSREEQDRFALESHRRAAKATLDGKFKDEIVPVDVPGQARVEIDEGVRQDTSLEKLAKLPPVFQQDGVVTAGNASQLSDGASAMVVMSREAADQHGVKPLARIVDYVTAGVKPELVMEAPIPAVRKILKRTGLAVEDFDLIEHNEAYAAASVAVMKELGIDHAKFNVNGGAVAMGHPLGCSGARILTTLAFAMQDRNARRGLATLCLGGGNAMAMILARP
jgi:acetyl-CoA C-acetyltransferase